MATTVFLHQNYLEKFLIWFLLIALVPAIYLSYSSYDNMRQIIEKEGLAKLTSIAEQRVHEINIFFMERERDITVQAKNPFIINAMERMVEQFTKSGPNSTSYRTEEKKIIPFLSTFEEKFALHDLLFISPDGDIVFTLKKETDLGINLLTDPYEDTEMEKAFKFSMTRKKISVSGFKLYEPSGQPTAFITAPVLKDDQVLGIIVFQLDPTLVYELAANYIGLGKSGEMVIAAMDGDDAVVSVPLRHNPQAAFKMNIKIGSEDALPIQDAVKGNEGSGISVDYRGKEILSVWKYIPKASWGIVVKIDTEEIFAPAASFLNRTLVIGIITVLLVLIFAVFVTRSIVNPFIELKQNLGSIAKGELPAKLDIRSRDEIGEINESMGIVIDSFKEVVSQASVIAGGNYRVDIALRSDKDELGIALQNMTASLRTAKEENKRNDWLKTGKSKLEDHLRGDRTIDELCKKIITFIANYLNVQVGTLYVNDGDGTFKLKASYAYKTRKNLSNEFKTGEGLIGQTALEKQSIILTNVPDDYITVASGLGEKKPKNILVIPFIYNEIVTGVLEIGSFDEFPDSHLTFLEEVSNGIAIAINSAQARVRLQEALEKTQRQAEDLESQQEELKAANEELEEQTQLLKESEERLKVQQEELQVTNEELEEKTGSLERQKHEVEQTNRDLDKAKREIEERAEELDIASKYKSEFLANMSHELRTPLNSMLLLANILADNKEGNLSEEQVESANVIYSSGNDLLALISEILDLSKIEAGQMDLYMGKILIRDLADRIKTNFQHMADNKGLDLYVVVSESAPEYILTDRKRMEQIIKNLMSNAIKFTEKGSITVDFSQATGDANLSRSGLDNRSTFAMAVKDTGIGIPPDKQKVIFEAFQQIEGGTARKYGGTGLGLSISRELVHLLGGEIQLRSEEGQGSTFTIYLPIEKADLKREEKKVLEQPAIPITPVGSKTLPTSAIPPIPDDRADLQEDDNTILIIEDDPRFAKQLLNQCHERGLKCIVSVTGEEGLKLVETYHPKAIILDIKLPGIDGWTVLEALKDSPETRHIPVHIISVVDATIDAFKKGAIGFLEKPAKREELEEALGKLEDVFSKKIKNLLVVEDDEKLRKSIIKLVGNSDVHANEAANGEEAIQRLKSMKYDCMILDLGLPDITGFELLKRLDADDEVLMPPVIVYTGRELTHEEETELNNHAESIIIKGVRSEERLLDEASLFLHRVIGKMPKKKRQIITNLHDTDFMLRDKQVLIADDDMRNVYALSRVLEDK